MRLAKLLKFQILKVKYIIFCCILKAIDIMHVYEINDHLPESYENRLRMQENACYSHYV